MGFAPFIKDSELRNATTQPGRALLRAEIGTAKGQSHPLLLLNNRYFFSFRYFLHISFSHYFQLCTATYLSAQHLKLHIVQIVKSPIGQSAPTAAETTTSAEPVTTTTAAVGTISTVLLVVGDGP